MAADKGQVLLKDGAAGQDSLDAWSQNDPAQRIIGATVLPLGELLVENFDAEGIWAQLQMNTDAAMPRIEKAVDALISKLGTGAPANAGGARGDSAQGAMSDDSGSDSESDPESDAAGHGQGDEDDSEDEDAALRARAAADPRLAKILARAEAADDSSDDEDGDDDDAGRQTAGRRRKRRRAKGKGKAAGNKGQGGGAGDDSDASEDIPEARAIEDEHFRFRDMERFLDEQEKDGIPGGGGAGGLDAGMGGDEDEDDEEDEEDEEDIEMERVLYGGGAALG